MLPSANRTHNISETKNVMFVWEMGGEFGGCETENKLLCCHLELKCSFLHIVVGPEWLKLSVSAFLLHTTISD